MIDWPLTVRACGVLTAAGIRTVDDLKCIGIDALAEMRNCGALTLAEIYCQALEQKELLQYPTGSRAKAYLRIATRQGRFPLFTSSQPQGIPFSPRAIIIALSRLGLLGTVPTLRMLATEHDLTPERIRQLEQKGLRWIRSLTHA